MQPPSFSISLRSVVRIYLLLRERFHLCFGDVELLFEPHN
jgi:hypothetical protein